MHLDYEKLKEKQKKKIKYLWKRVGNNANN